VTKEIATPELKVILFDLGGVLLHLRQTSSNFAIAGDEKQFHRAWLMSPSVRDFERGAIAEEEFSRRIVAELHLPYDWQEFMRRFDRWPEKIYAGVTDLLEQLAAKFSVALLSNTNAVHWGRNDIAGVLEPLFDQTFLSFRTGLLKPDKDAFDQVTQHYDCKAREILFLDDNPINIDAANAIGIRACLSRGMQDVHLALRRNGIETDKAADSETGYKSVGCDLNRREDLEKR
jgi:putative hydrolase of the HAD superfamily